MTLDEAIKRYENNAKYERAFGYALIGRKDVGQLAEWLKDYKRLSELESRLDEICMRHYRQGLEDASNKPEQIFSPE